LEHLKGREHLVDLSSNRNAEEVCHEFFFITIFLYTSHNISGCCMELAVRSTTTHFIVWN
jgi:hypothetical protein